MLFQSDFQVVGVVSGFWEDLADPLNSVKLVFDD